MRRLETAKTLFPSYLESNWQQDKINPSKQKFNANNTYLEILHSGNTEMLLLCNYKCKNWGGGGGVIGGGNSIQMYTFLQLHQYNVLCGGEMSACIYTVLYECLWIW